MQQPFVWISLLLAALSLPCSAQDQEPQEGDVKLVGTDKDYKGTVALYHNGKWGTICDDSWNYRDADVVCRMLGFERAYRIYYRAYFGQGPGTVNEIWIDQINCPNSAESLLDCSPPPSEWGNHDCKKSEDAGVHCLRKVPRKPAEMPVRLECPRCTQSGSCTSCPSQLLSKPGNCTQQVAVEGVVFAQYEGEWHPVSGNAWGAEESQVLCGELGYPVAFDPPDLQSLWTNWDGQYLGACSLGGLFYPQCDLPGINSGSGLFSALCSSEEIAENDAFRNSLGQTLLKKVQCEGNERRLLDCYFPEFGPHSSGLNVATVSCGFKLHPDCTPDDPSQEIYRTRGGAVPWQGRVEVRVDGQWATICDQDWDHAEANIICRAMGYGTAKRPHYRANYGRGVGNIHYTNLRCTGSESTLQECTQKTTGHVAQACGHQRDAGLECNVPQPCLDEDSGLSRLKDIPRPLYPTLYTDSYIEVKGSQGWGLLCRTTLTMTAANVVCRADRQMFALQLRTDDFPNYQGLRYVGQMDCKGDEMSLDKCKEAQFFLTSSCPGGKDAIIDCSPGLPDLVPEVQTIARSLQYYPYIDRTPLYYLQCAMEENCLSSSAEGQPLNHLRSLLRFDSLTINWGTTDFLPSSSQDQWEFHTCHNHYHSFEAFIHYDLLNQTTYEKVAEGHKASFCLEDSRCFGNTRRFGCSTGHQGISANCGDLYGRYLDCQWIDVTDVKPGIYLLRLHVNPDYLVLESDHRNNEVTCGIELTSGFGITYYWCRLSDH